MRFRRRLPAVPAAHEEIELPLPDVDAPLTLAEAAALARPAVAQIDGDSFLTLAASGPSLDSTGRSSRWELFFVLPNALARAEVAVHATPPWDRAELGPSRLVRRVTPLLQAGTILHELWKRGGADERKLLAASVASELDPANALPHRFVDSPNAVASFVAQGAELDAGSSQRTLIAERVGDTPTWRLELGREIYRLPFAAPQ